MVESKFYFLDDYWTHFHELTTIYILSFAKFLIYLFGIIWHFIIYLEKSFLYYVYKCIVVQSVTRLWLFATPWTAVCQTPSSFTIPQGLLKFMSIELVMLFNHLILCCRLLLLPSILMSIKVFSTESAVHIRWPNY